MTSAALQQLTPPGGWRTTPYARIPPLHRQHAGLAQRLLITGAGRFGQLDASNLWLMLMHNLRLLRGFIIFASRLMPYGELPRRDTELVILRVAWNCRARYEWGQHVDIGLRTALSEADIVQVTLGADAPNFEPRIKALMKACDEFHHERMVSASTWAELEKHYSTRKLLEVLMLIGHYEMLAGVLNSTGLPLDHKLDKLLEKV